jgi:CBS domain-containing protein
MVDVLTFRCTVDDTVLTAVRKMASAKVGALLVLETAEDDEGSYPNLVGILSERDYLTKVSASVGNGI